ncbi:hypothetical protein [Adlercreutzia aquisgranensis]|uniref:hypothetical protein n=1 Tax=Adlercreutzia aquisgranensis TaxID=2941323 RepID=UPI00203D55D4|nr:hypothetical protein [Adlercreutzia aquisgranensis]
MKPRLAILVVALAAVFSLIAFAIPFVRNEGFWVAYGFGLLAIVAQLYFMRSAFSQGDSAKSRVYGFPIARIGIVYLGVQFVASCVEMVCADWVPLWVYLVLDVVVLCLALAGCVATETAREEVVRQDARVAADTAAIMRLRAGAEALLAQRPGMAAESDIKRLAEALRFSDPVSHDSTTAIEQKLAASMADLRDAVTRGDEAQASKLAQGMSSDVEERNILCRLSK